jgi:hypothetical protein
MNFIDKNIVFYNRSRTWKKCDLNVIQYPLNFDQVLFTFEIRNTNDVYKRANDWNAGRNFSDFFFAYKDSKSKKLIFEEDTEYFNCFNRMFKKEFIKLREYDVLFGLGLVIMIPGKVYNESYIPEIGTIRFFTGYDFIELDQFFRWEWVGKPTFDFGPTDYAKSFFYISERHKPDVYGYLHSPVSAIYEEYMEYLYYSTIAKKLEFRKYDPIYIIENDLPKNLEQNKIYQDSVGTKIKTTHALDPRSSMIRQGIRDPTHERSSFFTDTTHIQNPQNQQDVTTRELDYVYYKVKRDFKPYDSDKNVAELNPLQRVKVFPPPTERYDLGTMKLELDRKLSSLLNYPTFYQSGADQRSKETMTAFRISSSTILGISRDISEYCDFAKIMFIASFGHMIEKVSTQNKLKLTDLKKDVFNEKKNNMFFLKKEDFNNENLTKVSSIIDQFIDQESVDLSSIVIRLRIKPFVIAPDTDILTELFQNQLIDKDLYSTFLSSIIGIQSNEFMDDHKLKGKYYKPPETGTGKVKTTSKIETKTTTAVKKKKKDTSALEKKVKKIEKRLNETESKTESKTETETKNKTETKDKTETKKKRKKENEKEEKEEKEKKKKKK